jgi:hypothetical protein
MGGSPDLRWRSDAPAWTSERNRVSMAARSSDVSWVERTAEEGDGGEDGEGGAGAANGEAGAGDTGAAAAAGAATTGRSTAIPFAPGFISTRTSPNGERYANATSELPS